MSQLAGRALEWPGKGHRALMARRWSVLLVLTVTLIAMAVWADATPVRFAGIGKSYGHAGCSPPGNSLSGFTECFRYLAIELNLVAADTPPATIMMQTERRLELGLADYQLRIGLGPTGARGGYGHPTQFTVVVWVSLVWRPW